MSNTFVKGGEKIFSVQLY